MSKRWKNYLAKLDKEDAKAAKYHSPWTTKRLKYGWIRLYREPYALALEPIQDGRYTPTWDEWHRRVKNVVPIQYFFRTMIPRWWHGLQTRLWYRWFDIKCFFKPRNIIRLKTIARDGAFPPVLMTHAIFEFLDSFMAQKPNEIIDYTLTKEDRMFWVEINEAWAWWKRRDERTKQIDKLYEKARKAKEKNEDVIAIYKFMGYEEGRFEEEETLYLSTIIKYRGRLWI